MGKAKSRTIAFPALAANRQLFPQGGMIRRTSFAESTGGAAAKFHLWDGSGPTGILLDTITLVANESARDQFKWDEYPVTSGVFFEHVAGSIDVVIAITPEWDMDEWGEPVIVIGQLDLSIVGS